MGLPMRAGDAVVHLTPTIPYGQRSGARERRKGGRERESLLGEEDAGLARRNHNCGALQRRVSQQLFELGTGQ